MTRFGAAPSLADIERIARDAFAALPEEFRRPIAAVVFKIEDFPDEETRREMELDSPFDLLGLYRGIDLGHKDGFGSPEDVDMIHLYRRPILDYWCETADTLERIVTHVLIHEIGHHFGLSDDDMEGIEAAAGREAPEEP